jgi:hypothetical protein
MLQVQRGQHPLLCHLQRLLLVLLLLAVMQSCHLPLAVVLLGVLLLLGPVSSVS